MKKISLISCFALLLTGCFGSGEKNESPKTVVINVMDEQYYKDCHIKGSIHIPFEDFDKKIQNLSKNNSYVLYCSNYACTTSDFCVKIMKKAGFANVLKYGGGIVEWYSKGYPVEGPCKMEYLTEPNENFDDEEHDSLIDAETLKKRMELS